MPDQSRPSPDGSPRGDNLGVQYYGGNNQAGNQAVGSGAQANAGRVFVQAAAPTADERAQIRELLALIERLLEEHRAALPDQESPRAELRRLREELDDEEPQPGVVRRALDRLTAFAQPVAPLAAAVGELSQAVQSF
ncbi:DUF5955 family protein [Streptomyces sp. PR69]|uniref:DUF5955 family protein n=1 Tax=Streptomyces sp. PR69 TaxID=2984950 RepID=UPI0022653AB7|nr:DUF5955 family protein [Streptomyces sp. PR69]